MKTNKNASAASAQNGNAAAKVASNNTTSTRVQAGTSYVERMRSHMKAAHTPTKAVKNAVQTTSEQARTDKQGALYAKAVAAVFDIKNAEQMKAALNALLAHYDGRTPKRGYSEYYVHQYFEKLIKTEGANNAACYNYLIYKVVKKAEEASK